MLRHIPRLPFTSVVDILFRHGGMLGLQRVYPGAWLFAFVRRTFGEIEWSEIICACHLVFNLQTPAHALYLLHPVDKTIPDSVGAWAVSSRHSDAYWILPVRRDLMVRAMKAFLPRGKVYEWLDSSDIMVLRPTHQWVAFALECIYNYRFTARWWRQVGRLDGDTMGEAIANLARDERARLETALVRAERMEMLRIKREKKEAKNAEGAKRAVKLTVKEEEAACAAAGQQFIRHKNLLHEIKTILARRRTFELPLAARRVMCVAKAHPKILWSLKALFHQIAQGTTWSIERELCRQTGYHALQPLEKLREGAF